MTRDYRPPVNVEKWKGVMGNRAGEVLKSLMYDLTKTDRLISEPRETVFSVIGGEHRE